MQVTQNSQFCSRFFAREWVRHDGAISLEIWKIWQRIPVNHWRSLTRDFRGIRSAQDVCSTEPRHRRDFFRFLSIFGAKPRLTRSRRIIDDWAKIIIRATHLVELTRIYISSKLIWWILADQGTHAFALTISLFRLCLITVHWLLRDDIYRIDHKSCSVRKGAASTVTGTKRITRHNRKIMMYSRCKRTQNKMEFKLNIKLNIATRKSISLDP